MMIKIYTDGSALDNPGCGGWSFVVPLEDRIHVESGGKSYTTNNRMELTAVIQAIEWCNKNEVEAVLIVADSSYVINAIEKDWLLSWSQNGWRTKAHTAVKNKDLWLKLLDCMNNTGITITLSKVKGHSGDLFNDMADEAARSKATQIKHAIQNESEEIREW